MLESYLAIPPLLGVLGLEHPTKVVLQDNFLTFFLLKNGGIPINSAKV